MATEHAAVSLYGESVTIEFADEALSQYRGRYQPGRRQLREVDKPQLVETPFRLPQLPLWELIDQDTASTTVRTSFSATPTIFSAPSLLLTGGLRSTDTLPAE